MYHFGGNHSKLFSPKILPAIPVSPAWALCFLNLMQWLAGLPSNKNLYFFSVMNQSVLNTHSAQLFSISPSFCLGFPRADAVINNGSSHAEREGSKLICQELFTSSQFINRLIHWRYQIYTFSLFEDFSEILEWFTLLFHSRILKTNLQNAKSCSLVFIWIYSSRKYSINVNIFFIMIIFMNISSLWIYSWIYSSLPYWENFLIQFKINEHEYIHEHFHKFIFIFMSYVLDHTGTFLNLV